LIKNTIGLDMYLSKKTYVGNNWAKDLNKEEATVIAPGIIQSRVTYIEESIGTWRKANAIHGWFIENVQEGNDDCGDYYVSEKKITELLKLVRKVLRSHDKAESTLPTTSGFFFGDQSYDEYYFEDMRHTEKILEVARKEIKDWGASIYYSSSW
jgi:hypothetical protein